MNIDSIYDQFKSKIMNKQPVEFLSNQDPEEDFQDENHEMLKGSINVEQLDILSKASKKNSILNTPDRKYLSRSPSSKSVNQDDDLPFKSANKDNHQDIQVMKMATEVILDGAEEVKDHDQALFRSEIQSSQNDRLRPPSQIQKSNSAMKNQNRSVLVPNFHKRDQRSPINTKFDHLVVKEEFQADDHFKNEIEQLKLEITQGVGLAQSDNNCLMPNSKFIFEKFSKSQEGEKFLESYSCAFQQKIILQGRLYVTNKRICFHSYFNAKTLIGKETKIQIPMPDIKSLEKRMNAMVFDNSIMVVTKEGKEYFFTSFVYRDAALDLIHKYMDGGNPDVSNSRTGSLEERPNEFGSENK